MYCNAACYTSALGFNLTGRTNSRTSIMRDELSEIWLASNVPLRHALPSWAVIVTDSLAVLPRL